MPGAPRSASRSRILYAVLTLISLSVSGCLTAETWEVRHSYDPGTDTWTSTSTYRNVGAVSFPMSADPVSPEALSEHFEGLLEAWKGDLPSQDTTGIEVIDRVLWVEGDVVCGRIVVVGPELEEPFRLSMDSKNIECGFIDSLPQIVETNGRVVNDDGEIVVRWPFDARDLRLTQRSFKPVHPFSQAHREEIIRMGGKKPKD